MKKIFIMKYVLILIINNSNLANDHALQFDGIDDYVQINCVADDVTKSITIEAWINAPPIYIGTTSGIVLGVNNAANENILLLYIGNGRNSSYDNEFVVYDGKSSAWEGISDTIVADGTWHHVAYTSDGTDGILYVDGILKDKHHVDYAFLPNHQWSLGQEYDLAVRTDFFNGVMDEVRIWNYPRTKEQIVSYMKRSLTGYEPGLIAYWQIDEGSGQVIGDSSGNENTAILGLTTSPEAEDPTWISSDAPVITGLGVLNHTPFGSVTEPFQYLDMMFSREINDTTFDDGDINLEGPNGIIPIHTLSCLGENIWRISFAEQSVPGNYHIHVGPNIEDTFGNEMDQDKDGIEGEILDDRYDGTVTILENYGLQFDGIDDYVQINSVADDMEDSVTIEAWINTSSIYAGEKKGVIVGVNYGSGGNTLLLSINDGMPASGNENEFVVYDGGSSAWEGFSDTIVTDGTWHHIAYSSDGTIGTLFVDGIAKATHTVDYTFHSYNIYSLGQEFDTAGPSDFFSGLIDDVRIWNYARTSEQIASYMRRQLTGYENGLIAYWRLDEGTGQIVGDITEYENNGQLGSTASSEIDDPEWIFTGILFAQGPWICYHIPSNSLNTYFASIDFIFNEAVDSDTFSTNDISLIGPTGLINIDTVKYQGNNIWRIFFPTQTTTGRYNIEVGPEILDLNGHAMDQDADYQEGEGIDDIYQGFILLDQHLPRINHYDPAGDIAGTVQYVDVWFSKIMYPPSLNLSNVSIDGPLGYISPKGINEIGINAFRISFDPQFTQGEYHVRIGPNIIDAAGNFMDQNQNGIGCEDPNDVFDAKFNLVDVDLTISNVIVDPNQLIAGELITVSWNGANKSGMPLLGNWNDGIYLSMNDTWDIDDILLTTITHTGGLSQDEVYTDAAIVPVPGALPGKYYIIVRADIYNQQKEGANEGNNIAARGPLSLVVRQLETNSPSINGTLTKSDLSDYYMISIEQGKYVKIDLEILGTNTDVDIFTSFAAIPSRMKYDHFSATTDQGNQQLVIPSGLQGIYYILVYGKRLNNPTSYNISASAWDLIVTDICPDRHGRSSVCTMTINGAVFDDNISVEFVGTDLSVRTPTQIQILSPTTMIVELDIPTWSIDLYDLTITKTGVDPYVIQDAFEVVEGQAHLETRLRVPRTLGYHWPATIWIEYANNGETSLPAPLFKLHGTDNAILTRDKSLAGRGLWTYTPPSGTSDTIQVMATGSGATPGILQPGDAGRIPIYYLGLKRPWNGKDRTIEFNLGVLTADSSENIDWPMLKAEIQPDWLDDESWNAVWLNFVEQVGNTWGDYLLMLDDNMNHLSQIGFQTDNVTELLAFEFRQADGLSPIRYLSDVIDASVDAPGMNLEFARAYAQPVSRRYQLGPLGRGWTHSWQIHLEEAPNGDVTIFDMTGTPRIFVSNGTGAYTPRPGDYGVLKKDQSGNFILREQDKFKTVFQADGKLNYVEDRNGNRITAGFNGDLLTTLTHSNGRQLLIGYSPDGRITQLTDPRGPDPEDDCIITYEYDAGGEYLERVILPGNRITCYSYHTEGDMPQQLHALVSIEYPDASHHYFLYDEKGRLTGTQKDNGTEPLTYGFDSAGTVIAEDATGKKSTLYFTPSGQIAQVRDGEGNTVNLCFGENNELTTLRGGLGQKYNYTYDNRGNLVKVEDPLHNMTRFTYNASYNSLTSVTDAKGNRMQYGYDGQGNLTAITYENGTMESYAYDANGNITSWTNRRGDSVSYTYDAAGHILSKDYSTTPEFIDCEYEYDEAGNLISARDPNGIMTFAYDLDTDWLTRIDYPDDFFFTFEYDNLGRRTKRTDQDGAVTSYSYDNAGRLDVMTNDANDLIVDYDYDAAGRMILKTLGNGVYTTYEYDAAGRVTHLVNCDPNNNIRSRFDYTYDAAGRRTSMATLEGTHTYGYDPLGQLVKVNYPARRIVEYIYDSVGNRLEVIDDGVSTPYTTNNMNQYTRVGSDVYEYDDDGNLIRKINSIITSYIYDIENRLIEVDRPGMFTKYSYNALGARVSSTRYDNITTYINDPIGYTNVASEYDLYSNMVAKYEHGLGLISYTDNSYNTYFYTYDALGSTSEITDEKGSEINAYRYGPFGISLYKSENINNSFRYIGEYGIACENNNLYSMRKRYYDVQTGRFLTQDPLKIASGDICIYKYAGNNPISQADHMGLYSTPTWCKIAGDIILDAKFGAWPYWKYLRLSQASATLYNDIMTESSWSGAMHGWGVWGLKVFLVAKFPLIPATGRMVDIWDRLTLDAANYYYSKKYSLDYNSGFCGWSKNPPEISDPNTDNSDNSNNPLAFMKDPNKKNGPAGQGKANFIRSKEMMSYQIQYENLSDATAPAHKIVITDTLDENLDLETMELTEIKFADHTIIVPPGMNYYQESLDITVDNEYVGYSKLRVEIEASLNEETRNLTCTLLGLDPNTGWLPENIMLGVLYPNDDTGRGDGHVSYVVKPKPGLPTGTVISNKASIIFDWNDPIETPLVTNTLYAPGFFEGDFNGDGSVNLADLSKLLEYWLSEESSLDIVPKYDGDGIINIQEFSELAGHWLEEFQN